jgi:hypothetical protein
VGSPGDPGDPYKVESVRKVLAALLDQLAGGNAQDPRMLRAAVRVAGDEQE